ncbi:MULTISPECIES: malonyl-ACP O-methyltransferase BioC [Deefgea]|uniref:Malonyl-[acyl-carrier protein] O-methyltransferase n=1 Tax=Deefgea chitinilytica TaxID=570276 RepID=A0ABS2C9D7_9NEIS|nr:MULTISPECIES: malonyl-ACP O-methyltransferase BioC [Deefgea]MBM5570767.1 malonyl-ACP O-methyltransferase BioC [Deefgea chitinilytica]MBM9887996.1 malonyl-ACP O-methyltransferase BioC [Deefgea sp. CFH1-16]
MIEPFYNEKELIRESFDRAAATYDAAAVLQKEVVERLFERLTLINLQPQVILDAGSGTGAASQLLKERYRNAQFIELDLAFNMLKTAQAKTSGLKKWLSFLDSNKSAAVCADIEHIPLANESVDLIWSSLTIQWCNTPDAAFKEFARILKPGGVVIFSSLGPDTLKELRAAFKGVDEHEHVNQFIDMHDLGDALVAHGLTMPVMDMEYITMTYPSVKAVMHDLKHIGASNKMNGRRNSLLGKSAWQKIQSQYENFRHNGVLPCTYEVVYGHAWKPANKPAALADGRQIIEFRPRERS